MKYAASEKCDIPTDEVIAETCIKVILDHLSRVTYKSLMDRDCTMVSNVSEQTF